MRWSRLRPLVAAVGRQTRADATYLLHVDGVGWLTDAAGGPRRT